MELQSSKNNHVFFTYLCFNLNGFYDEPGKGPRTDLFSPHCQVVVSVKWRLVLGGLHYGGYVVEVLKDLPPSVLLALTLGLGMLFIALLKACGWVFEKWWGERKERQDKHDKALTENTLAIVKLQVQMERLNEFLHVIPEMQKDISALHKKIREITPS